MGEEAAVITSPGSDAGEAGHATFDIAGALEHLQDEMELIGYAASHDLLAPLRMMLASCETLKEKSGFSADAEGQEALQSLEAHTRQLIAMLKGIQESIRLETFQVAHGPLDSGELLGAALEVMAEDIRAAGATVTSDPLPQVMGHRGRLTHLFIHLIENALKFRGVQAPRVHIGAKRAGIMWEFTAEDNGIGIEEECQELIFRLFHRLHPVGAYPGYGIGLALSRKIVASHGGRLWIESTPGRGSRFIFTLPAAGDQAIVL